MSMQWLHADRAIIGDGKTVLSPVWVGIQGATLKFVSNQPPGLSTPENTRSLKDVTLCPGLLNLHDHISRKGLRDGKSSLSFTDRATIFMQEDSHYLLLHSVSNARNALLREGITFMRDFGLAGYTSIHLRRGIREGLIIGPEISTCGRPICMTGGHTYRQSHEADGPEAIQAAVRAELKAGADIIKFMASGGIERFPGEDPHLAELTEAELRAGVETAHEAGVMTSAHTFPAKAILNVIRAGVDVVEHGVLMNDQCVKEMIDHGTCLVPTLTGLRAIARLLPDTPENDLLRQALEERIYAPHEESVRKAISNGIPVGTGTDSIGHLHEEIQLIARIMNYTPVQALAHATSISAKIARREDLGLLKEGLRAHLVAFRGDLTRSLDPLREVVCVWKDGRLCS
jgi:imidazolonepropionase-like amidohydrolase